MTNTATNETAPWRSPSGKYAVRWVHLSIGWRFWAFERNTGDDVGHFTSKAEAIAACEREEQEGDEETRRIENLSMKQIVFGFEKPAKRRRLTLRLVLMTAFLSTAWGCATGRPMAVDAPETVGALAPSYNSIAVAPVHATTDLTPSFGAVDTDEDAAAPVTVSAPADGGGADAELPEATTKAAHGF